LIQKKAATNIRDIRELTQIVAGKVMAGWCRRVATIAMVIANMVTHFGICS
jgi:hypothetical protein